jgi:hypothetical protein
LTLAASLSQSRFAGGPELDRVLLQISSLFLHTHKFHLSFLTMTMVHGHGFTILSSISDIKKIEYWEVK